MQIIVTGRLIPFVLMIVVSAIFLYFSWRAKKSGKGPQIRKIAGLDALEEGVGRAAETGRPVLWTAGLPLTQRLYTGDGVQLLASISILNELCRLSAIKQVKVVAAVGQAELLPAAEEAARLGYLKGGKPDLFKLENIVYLPEQAYTVAIAGFMMREKFPFCVFAGPLLHEAIILGEVGQTIGAFAVGGTAAVSQIPFLIATCDFTLIGEELMAAGAYVAKDPGELGGFLGEDIGKVIALILAIVGTITVSLGVNTLVNLLKM